MEIKCIHLKDGIGIDRQFMKRKKSENENKCKGETILFFSSFSQKKKFSSSAQKISCRTFFANFQLNLSIKSLIDFDLRFNMRRMR
jgi:hypothetical protein